MPAGYVVRVSFGSGFDPIGVELPDLGSAESFASAFALGFRDRVNPAGCARCRGGARESQDAKVCQHRQSACNADYRLSWSPKGWRIEAGGSGVLADGRSFAQAVGLLDSEFEGRLRKTGSPATASLHSCGVLTSRGAVEILGVSGSGKTTLGLACAESGLRHIGDEFGFVDLDNGLSWHAEYPVGIKCGSRSSSADANTEPCAALPRLRAACGLRCETPFGICSTLYARDVLGKDGKMQFARPDERRILRAMVSVRRDEGATPSLRALPLSKWVRDVMPSVDAGLTRQEIFSGLVSLASRHGVEFLRLVYSEACDGAALLLDHFAR